MTKDLAICIHGSKARARVGAWARGPRAAHAHVSRCTPDGPHRPARARTRYAHRPTPPSAPGPPQVSPSQYENTEEFMNSVEKTFAAMRKA